MVLNIYRRNYMKYTLPTLPYGYNALEPAIDAQTMEIHHTKHHATYVQKLNDALAKVPALADEPLEKLLADYQKLPADVREAIRNHGGGHLNHSLFWTILDPKGGGNPPEPLAGKLSKTFGNFETFTEQFSAVAANRFGSGWAWLCLTRTNDLVITSTANQDSPYMEGFVPIMGLDVWEHAYYLKYQNRRPEYIKAFWSIVNWAEVNRLLGRKTK